MGPGTGASPAKFQHWREQTSVVQDVSAFRTGVVNLTGGAFPEQLQSAQVSADFFRLVRRAGAAGTHVHPAGGPAEGREGGDPQRELLAKALRRRPSDSGQDHLPRRRSARGDRHHRRPHSTSGSLDRAPDVWVAFQLDPNTKDQGHYFTAAGRLKPGVTLEQAKARLQVSAADYRRKFPTALPANQGFSVEPIREALVNERAVVAAGAGGRGEPGAADCVRQCGQSAAGARHRTAPGDGDPRGDGRGARPHRSSIADGKRAAVAGRGGGRFGGGHGGNPRAAQREYGQPSPRRARKAHWSAWIGGCWFSRFWWRWLTGLLFGLIPALQTSRPDLSATLKESSGRSGTGFRQNKARTLLAVSEIALAVVLLVGAALLIRTFLALGGGEPGLRCGQRADDENVADRPALRQIGGNRAAGAGWRGARQRAARRDARQRHLLRAVGGRLRPAVPGDGAATHRRSVPRRRRVADGFARLFRSVQDSDSARPCLHGARRRRHARRW